VYVVTSISASSLFVFSTAPPALLPTGIIGASYGAPMVNMFGATTNNYPANVVYQYGFNFINQGNSVALGWYGNTPSSAVNSSNITVNFTGGVVPVQTLGFGLF
jgi:hypothetical protein